MKILGSRLSFEDQVRTVQIEDFWKQEAKGLYHAISNDLPIPDLVIPPHLRPRAATPPAASVAAMGGRERERAVPPVGRSGSKGGSMLEPENPGSDLQSGEAVESGLDPSPSPKSV